MEGQFGSINGEMGNAAQPISVGPEFTGTGTTQEGSVKSDPRNPENKMSLEKNTSHPTEEPDREADKNQSAGNADEDKTEAKPENEKNEPQQEAEIDSVVAEEKLTEEQIKENFDKLWDQLDDGTKKQFTKLSKKEEKKEQKEKVEKTPLAFLRAIRLVFRIIALSIVENKTEFTGEDLNLGTTPLEGTNKIYYQNGSLIKSDESWKKFTQAVAGIGKDTDDEKGKSALTFGQFLNAVLDLNTKCTEGIVVLSQESDKGEKNAKKLELLKSLIDNKAKEGSGSSFSFKTLFRSFSKGRRSK